MPNANVVVCVAVVDVRGTTKVQVVVTAQSPNALWNIRLAQINCSSVRIPGKQVCISWMYVAAQQEARQPPCGLVLRYQRVRGNYRLHLRGKEGHDSGMRKGQWDCDLQQMWLTFSAYFCPEDGSSRFLSTKLHGIMYQKLVGQFLNPKHQTQCWASCPINVLSIQCTSLRAISFFIFQPAPFQETSPPNLCKLFTSQCA
jgi:hypothetical protein